jgi:tetratricopeptide (TPR) repeat protein
LPAEKPTREGEKSGFTGELVDEQLINAYQKTSGAFWEGVAASLRQDWPGARENFSTALRLSESLPEAYFGRGVARYHLGEYEGAAQDLERATQGLSNYALGFLWLGKVWERQDRGEAAFAAYQKPWLRTPTSAGLVSYGCGQLPPEGLTRASGSGEERG